MNALYAQHSSARGNEPSPVMICLSRQYTSAPCSFPCRLTQVRALPRIFVVNPAKLPAVNPPIKADTLTTPGVHIRLIRKNTVTSYPWIGGVSGTKYLSKLKYIAEEIYYIGRTRPACPPASRPRTSCRCTAPGTCSAALHACTPQLPRKAGTTGQTTTPALQ